MLNEPSFIGRFLTYIFLPVKPISVLGRGFPLQYMQVVTMTAPNVDRIMKSKDTIASRVGRIISGSAKKSR